MPPGFSTRRHSFTSARSPPVYCTTPCAKTKSNVSSSNGSCSPSASRRSAVSPCCAKFSLRQRDRRRRQVHAGDDRRPLGEPHQVGPGAAADVEHPLAAIGVEVDQPRQVVQLLEVVLIEIGEELPRARTGWRADVEIVDVVVPVVANGGVVGGHAWMRCAGARYYKILAMRPRDFGRGDRPALRRARRRRRHPRPRDGARRGGARTDGRAGRGGDFAAATSFNHQRTAHGGLRSLQTGRIGHARESIRERRALARIAPRLLRPLPFIVGTYRSWLKSRARAARGVPDRRWLGRHRNDGVEPELHLPPPRLTSRAATLKLFPGIRPDGLTGGANWYDYQMVHANRLSIAFAEGADARGARLVNYAAGDRPLQRQRTIAGMRVRDVLDRQRDRRPRPADDQRRGCARRRRHEDVRRARATSRC